MGHAPGPLRCPVPCGEASAPGRHRTHALCIHAEGGRTGATTSPPRARPPQRLDTGGCPRWAVTVTPGCRPRQREQRNRNTGPATAAARPRRGERRPLEPMTRPLPTKSMQLASVCQGLCQGSADAPCDSFFRHCLRQGRTPAQALAAPEPSPREAGGWTGTTSHVGAPLRLYGLRRHSETGWKGP